MRRGDYKLLHLVDTDNQGVGILDYKFFCGFFALVACLRHEVGVVCGVLLGPTLHFV